MRCRFPPRSYSRHLARLIFQLRCPAARFAEEGERQSLGFHSEYATGHQTKINSVPFSSRKVGCAAASTLLIHKAPPGPGAHLTPAVPNQRWPDLVQDEFRGLWFRSRVM